MELVGLLIRYLILWMVPIGSAFYLHSHGYCSMWQAIVIGVALFITLFLLMQHRVKEWLVAMFEYFF